MAESIKQFEQPSVRQPRPFVDPELARLITKWRTYMSEVLSGYDADFRGLPVRYQAKRAAE